MMLTLSLARTPGRIGQGGEHAKALYSCGIRRLRA